MTSANAQTPKTSKTPKFSKRTLKNFEDFNNMFREIDREDFTPCDIADMVCEKVRLERKKYRLYDMCMWSEEGEYF